MSDVSPSEFSFDLYPGLDADLQAAYVRNVQQGNASPELVATAGIAAAVNDTLSQMQPETLSGVPTEVEGWAKQDLEATGGALETWGAYRAYFGVDVPAFVDQLAATHPNLAPTLQRLHEAKQALTASGEVTPSNQENIGDTMHLVIMPWQGFKDNLGDLEAFIKRLRNIQGIETEDYIGPNVINAIVPTSNTRFYKSWDNPGALYTAAEYLEQKIQQDGPWGVALVQTSDEPGVRGLLRQSPDDITGRFDHSPTVAGQTVGSMGIFEWLALTLQADPKQLSTQYYSWMLANRTEVSGDPGVPVGGWRDGQVGSGLGVADYQYEHARPRLAVM